MTYSTLVDRAISLAEEAGNAVVEISTGWSKMREVVVMRDPLTNPLRCEIQKIKGLRGYRYAGTPHNRAEEGFVDDNEKVEISFPWINEGLPFGYRRLVWIPAVLIIVVLGLLVAAMLHFSVW